MSFPFRLLHDSKVCVVFQLFLYALYKFRSQLKYQLLFSSAPNLVGSGEGGSKVRHVSKVCFESKVEREGQQNAQENVTEIQLLLLLILSFISHSRSLSSPQSKFRERQLLVRSQLHTIQVTDKLHLAPIRTNISSVDCYNDAKVFPVQTIYDTCPSLNLYSVFQRFDLTRALY